MNIIICTYIFIIGLIIGSFLNVCIYRIPKGESISYPPSHCTVCGKRIKPYDLIPVISWIILRGKCRSCGDRISIRYALIEMATGISFILTYLKYGLTLEGLKFFILIPFIIVIGMIDFDTTDIYSITTWSAIAIGIVFIIINYFLGMPVKNYILGGLTAGGFITFIILLTKGMGWGDAELCLLCGLFLGFKQSLLMLMLSFIIGGISALLLILLKKKTRKDYIPFGPSIAMGALIVMFFGGRILEWYFQLFI